MTHHARALTRALNITLSIAAIFFILLIFQPTAWAIEQNDCITAYTYGSVNWRTGVVQATGKASPSENLPDEPPDAILIRAKLDAQQNLNHILMEIAFNRAGRDVFLSDDPDPVMAGVERRTMDATLTHQRYTSDRAMEVTIATSIFGGFLQLVLPEEIGEVAGLKIILPRKKTLEKTQVEPEPYTGLIIDARGIDFQPTINPVIFSEQGDEIYSSKFISREYAVQAGVCQYICAQGTIQQDPIQAALWKNSLTGPNPLVVRGLRKGSKTNRSIVISRSDASAVEQTAERHHFMRQCRVIIVLDQ